MADGAPIRIQLHRTRGWRLPDGAISCARPHRFGNPFMVSDVVRRFPSLTVEQASRFVVNEFRDLVGWWHLDQQDPEAPRELTFVVPLPGGGRQRRVVTYPSITTIRAELGGHDLACWCGVSMSCHVDVLLDIANPRARL